MLLIQIIFLDSYFKYHMILSHGSHVHLSGDFQSDKRQKNHGSVVEMQYRWHFLLGKKIARMLIQWAK
jgi:hypothetical protein